MEGRLRAINSFAPIQRCQQSQVAVGDVLALRAFDLQRTLEMDDGFLDTDAEHEHDASVSSLAIVQPGEVDAELLEGWIGDLLRDRGADIFRTKGILAIAGGRHGAASTSHRPSLGEAAVRRLFVGSPKKCVFQGVHMIFNSALGGEWAEGEPRESRLVFIGKNLQHEELRAGFSACLATPQLDAQRRAALRFEVGAHVQCKVAPDEWAKGRVVAQCYRNTPEEGRAGGVSPYQVELDGGDLIFVPLDDDQVIRRA